MYLKNHLEGEPALLVEGFFGDEFAPAMALLGQKYGDKTQYISRLYDELLNLESPRNFEELQQFSLNTQSVISLLKKNGEDVEQRAVHHPLEKKLAHVTGALREILKEKEKAGAAWNTSMFTENLKAIVSKEERLKAIATSAKAEESEKAKLPPPKPKTRQRAEQPTLTFSTVDLPPVKEKAPKVPVIPRMQECSVQPWRKNQNQIGKKPSSQKEKPTLKCRLCANAHFTSDCTTYPSFEERRNRVISQRLCFKCLDVGHSQKACTKRQRPCYYCKESHNSTLCKKRDQRPPESTLATSTSDNRRTLLMTLYATVYNPSDPIQKASALIFIDPGSKRSFIRNELAEKLQLKTLGNETFKV